MPTASPTPAPTLEPIDDYDVSIVKAGVTACTEGYYEVNAALLNDIPEYDSYQLIAATYDEGKLVNISAVYIYNGDDSAQFSFYGEHVDCIKLFAWKGLNDMRPLCDAVTIDEADFITE